MEENLVFLKLSKGYDDKSFRELSPLALAFLGDGVYELLVRTYVLDKNKLAGKLHKEAVNFVKAKAQSESIRRVLSKLSEDEKAVFNRGKNAKPHTMAKNQTTFDYKMATGLEALFGYLYLLNRGDRILELFKLMGEIE